VSGLSVDSFSVKKNQLLVVTDIRMVSQPKENVRLRQQSLSSTSVGGFQIQKLGTRDLRELSSYILFHNGCKGTAFS
jgi:hypothetical protein